MNRIAAYLTWAALGAVLVASGPAWAQAYRYSPDGYAYDYGSPNNYANGYGSPNNYAYGRGVVCQIGMPVPQGGGWMEP